MAVPGLYKQLWHLIDVPFSGTCFARVAVSTLIGDEIRYVFILIAARAEPDPVSVGLPSV